MYKYEDRDAEMRSRNEQENQLLPGSLFLSLSPPSCLTNWNINPRILAPGAEEIAQRNTPILHDNNLHKHYIHTHTHTHIQNEREKKVRLKSIFKKSSGPRSNKCEACLALGQHYKIDCVQDMNGKLNNLFPGSSAQCTDRTS